MPRIISGIITGCTACILIMFCFHPLSCKAQQKEASQEAIKYFDRAFMLIKNNFYRSNDVDFKALHQLSMTKMEVAYQPPDTYEAIRLVVSALNDKHTRFTLPKKASGTATPKAGRPAFKSYELNPEYGVIELYSYSSLDVWANMLLADSLYAILKGFDKDGKKGLILDLRKMEGGSLDPFLCGLAPLIKEGELFTFVGKGKQREKIYFENGRLIRQNGKAKRGTIYLRNYQQNARLSSMNVTVITGPYTASAGEQIVIALKGMPNVRIVGESTYGVPTGVVLYQLSDGASLALASSVVRGRDGKIYDSAIAPDVGVMLGSEDLKDSYPKVLGIK